MTAGAGAAAAVRHYGQLEHDIEEACRAADGLRLAIAPATKRFAEMWATFRRHHEQLDGSYKFRRRRGLVWRAAALTVICARNRFQDVVDARQACRDDA
jgi:hypothetical protein